MMVIIPFYGGGTSNSGRCRDWPETPYPVDARDVFPTSQTVCSAFREARRPWTSSCSLPCNRPPEDSLDDTLASPVDGSLTPQGIFPRPPADKGRAGPLDVKHIAGHILHQDAQKRSNANHRSSRTPPPSVNIWGPH